VAGERSPKATRPIAYRAPRRNSERFDPDTAPLPDQLTARRARKRRVGVTNQETSPIRAVRHCCRHPIPDYSSEVAIVVRHNVDGESSVRFGGVMQCRNPRICFHCSPWLARERAATVDAIAQGHDRGGGCTPMLTLTIPHALGDDYPTAWRAVGAAVTTLLAHRVYRELRAEFEIAGHIRALETTHGPNGFHPHAHVLLLFGRRPSAAELERVRAQLYRVWVQAVELTGLPGIPSEEHGLDLRIFDGELRGEYIAKMSRGLELSSADTKTAAGGLAGYRSMAQVAADMHDGDAGSSRIWYAYSRGQSWQRMLTYSRGLKRRYADDIELALAALVEDPALERVEEFTVHVRDWYAYVKPSAAMLCMVIEAAKCDGEAGVRHLFTLAAAIARDHPDEKSAFRVLRATAKGWQLERTRIRRESYDGTYLGVITGDIAATETVPHCSATP
jgi:hypothetical protein